jgi:hypothetical protein
MNSLMKNIINYDKDNMNEEIINKLRETINKEEFNLDKLR